MRKQMDKGGAKAERWMLVVAYLL